jgi:GTP-binding protein of the ras superfamily involved in termination of M-phase
MSAPEKKAEEQPAAAAAPGAAAAAAEKEKDAKAKKEKEKDDLEDAGDELMLSSGKGKKKVTVKVGMVGDSGIGKTSLMVKYVEGNFNEDYIQTLGVNFMQKTIELKNAEITFSIWDLGGQQEYLHMLPLVCNDAVALLFMFDLSRKSTLTSVKNWYKQARLLNKNATPFLIGTKYDHFAKMNKDEAKEITDQARRFAKAMKAPLIFCSASAPININKIFKIVLSKVFQLKCTVAEISTIGHPIIEYTQW